MMTALKALLSIIGGFLQIPLLWVRDKVREGIRKENRSAFLLSIALICTIGFSFWQFMQALDAKEKIQTITVERDSAYTARNKAVAARDKAVEETKAAVAEANNWRQKFEQLSQANADAINEATARQKEAQEADKRIIAELTARAEKAERNSVQRMFNYDKASAVCKATIDALPTNCKELGPLK